MDDPTRTSRSSNGLREMWLIRNGSLQYRQARLAFFVRTINLDGKIYPESLRARIEEGYVVNHDWAGITDHVEQDLRFSQEFEIVVRDQQRNLGVLRRARPVESESAGEQNQPH